MLQIKVLSKRFQRSFKRSWFKTDFKLFGALGVKFDVVSRCFELTNLHVFVGVAQIHEEDLGAVMFHII